MAIFRLPIFLDTRYFTYTLQLDGTSFGLRFSYITRTSSWYVDLHDEEDNPVVRGVRIDVDKPLFLRYGSDAKPPGMFVALSLEAEDNSPPNLAALGRRVRVIYLDDAELPPAPPVSTDIVDVSPTPGP